MSNWAHHYFCYLLGGVHESITALPDFSDDNKIAVMFDFGEPSDSHLAPGGAHVNTRHPMPLQCLRDEA